MKKNDYIILSIIIALVIAIYFIWNISFSQAGNKVVVVINNTEIATYSLNEEATFGIQNGQCLIVNDVNFEEYANVFEIHEGKVNMLVADCPDKICVNHVSINKSGEAIVCMPNKTYIAIE